MPETPHRETEPQKERPGNTVLSIAKRLEQIDRDMLGLDDQKKIAELTQRYRDLQQDFRNAYAGLAAEEIEEVDRNLHENCSDYFRDTLSRLIGESKSSRHE